MSICIIALVIFAFMGIFSAKYRRWAKEAFSCVGRRITLRPCETGFNERMKAKLTGKLIGRSPKMARITHKYFEPLSWIFTIILIVSLILMAYGLINLAIHGTCDPLNPDDCPFAGTEQCSVAEYKCKPCLCGDETIGCSAPEYLACSGDCDCIKDICTNKL